MTRASPILTAFNAGEVSKTLEGRVDLPIYAKSCKLIEGFLPLAEGPLQRRGGSRYVAGSKQHGLRSWQLRFEFSATQAFTLEFGDRYVRFFTQHGQLLVSGVAAWNNATNYVEGDLVVQGGINYYCILAHINHVPPNATYWYALTGAIYEIPSPYLQADLTNDDGTCAIQAEQSGDVLYITNMKGTYETRKLTRLGNTDWVFSLYRPTSGPFLEKNDGATTIQASASTGSVTLTASSALFAVTDIARLVRIEVQNLDVLPWETNKLYAINDLVRSDGKTYKALNGATSGTATPVHEKGNAYDGKSGVQWAYQDSGYGIARISAFTSPTQVTADVVVDEGNGLQQLPAGVVSTATKRWALGAWSATTEYPRTVSWCRDRLALAGKQRWWLTVPDSFEDMSGDFFGLTSSDCAIWGILQSTNEILWLAESDKLLMGTPGGVYALGEITTTDPLGPDNVKVVRQNGRRCRAVRPVLVDTSIIFVHRAGRRLFSLDYEVTVDRFKSTDLSALAKHITRSGIIDMAYQAEPESILWCVLGSGELVALTLNQEQEVTAWHRHPMGGDTPFVENVAVVPSPDGTREEVWICVRRTINGQIRRYYEFIEKCWEEGDAPEDVFYVDAGLTYSGAATDTISGLDHLEAETVQVAVDGATHKDCVVSSGTIVLEREGSKVQIGLHAPARLITQRLEAGAQDGTAQGKMKRAEQAVVRFVDTLGGKVGMNGRPLTEIQFRKPSMAMNEPPTIFDGDKVVDLGGDYERDARVEVLQDQPFPMTILAIMPRMRTYER